MRLSYKSCALRSGRLNKRTILVLATIQLAVVALGARDIHTPHAGRHLLARGHATNLFLPNHVVDDAGVTVPTSVAKAASALVAPAAIPVVDPAGVSCQLEFVYAWGPYPKLNFKFEAAITKTSEWDLDMNNKKQPKYKVDSVTGTLTKWYSSTAYNVVGLDLLPTTDPNFPYLGADDRVVTWTDLFGVQRVLTEKGIALLTSESAFYVLSYNATRRFYVFKSSDPDPGVGFRPALTAQCQWIAKPPPPVNTSNFIVADIDFNFYSDVVGTNVNINVNLGVFLKSRATCTGSTCAASAAASVEFPYQVAKLSGTVTTKFPGYRYVETVDQVLGSDLGNDNLARDPTSTALKTKGLFSNKGVAFVTDRGNNYIFSNENNNNVIDSSTNGIVDRPTNVVNPDDFIVPPVYKNFTRPIVCYDSSKFKPPVDPGLVDILFVSDVTGSMKPAIESVRAKARAIFDILDSSAMSIQYSVGEYRDVNTHGDYFNVILPIGSHSSSTLQSAFDSWSKNIGGGGGWGGQVYALYKIASVLNNPLMWRTDSTKYVVLFGDEKPPEQPIQGVTVQDAVKVLQARSMHVFAINAGRDGKPGNLNGDKNRSAGTIANATGGLLLDIVYENVGQELLKRLPSFVRKYVAVQPIAGACTRNATLLFEDYRPKTIEMGKEKACFTPVMRFDVSKCQAGTIQCSMTVSDLSGTDLYTANDIAFTISKC